MTRYLALDVGDERIGVAISDELGILARPLAVLLREPGPGSFLRLGQIIQREDVDLVIVGMPLLENGTAGKQVQSTQAYVRGLRTHIDVPIVYVDERYSTVRAKEIVKETGSASRRDYRGIDAVAAAVILQDYIDQQTEERS